MNILANKVFDWCSNGGVLNVFKIIKTFLKVVRFAVPIILVFITTMDIFKHVINPNEKDGMKTIFNRIIAAVIVFFVPTVVNIVMKLVNIGLNSNEKTSYNVTDCWLNAEKIIKENYDSGSDIGLKPYVPSKPNDSVDINTPLTETAAFKGVLTNDSNKNIYYNDYYTATKKDNIYKSGTIYFNSPNNGYVRYCIHEMKDAFDINCTEINDINGSSVVTLEKGKTYMIQLANCDQFKECKGYTNYYVSLDTSLNGNNDEPYVPAKNFDVSAIVSAVDFNNKSVLALGFSYVSAISSDKILKNASIKFDLLGGATKVHYCFNEMNSASDIKCNIDIIGDNNTIINFEQGKTYYIRYKSCNDNASICNAYYERYLSLDSKYYVNVDTSSLARINSNCYVTANSGHSNNCLFNTYAEAFDRYNTMKKYNNGYSKVDYSIILPSGFDSYIMWDIIVSNEFGTKCDGSEYCLVDDESNGNVLSNTNGTISGKGMHLIYIIPKKSSGIKGKPVKKFIYIV